VEKRNEGRWVNSSSCELAAGILINRARARFPFTRIKKKPQENLALSRADSCGEGGRGERFTVRWAESSTLRVANSWRTPVMFEQSPRTDERKFDAPSARSRPPSKIKTRLSPSPHPAAPLRLPTT